MRKSHPCGGNTWRVVRLGAEIGIRCMTCNRRVLLPRSEFERRIKRFIERGSAADHQESSMSQLPEEE
ncbi:MAG: DUF951 domain-containing protein [Chloroflexales bacterium]|nr:DUF951 domain-containing protein [Chloroflexales bacterium]